MGNGKFKKRREGGGKLDVGTCGTAGRLNSRATRTKKVARDMASGKNLTLKTVTRSKK